MTSPSSSPLAAPPAPDQPHTIEITFNGHLILAARTGIVPACRADAITLLEEVISAMRAAPPEDGVAQGEVAPVQASPAQSPSTTVPTPLS